MTSKVIDLPLSWTVQLWDQKSRPRLIAGRLATYRA